MEAAAVSYLQQEALFQHELLSTSTTVHDPTYDHGIEVTSTNSTLPAIEVPITLTGMYVQYILLL